MATFHDRREGQPDFADGSGHFSLATRGDEQAAAWSDRPVDRSAKRDVHGYYRGQKDTQTWRKANQLAARRTGRQTYKDADEYSGFYEHNLSRVLNERGPELAKQFGEIRPGR